MPLNKIMEISIVSIILFKGIPNNSAVIIEVMINEINVFNFKNIIKVSKITIPSTTLMSGQISPNITFPFFLF